MNRVKGVVVERNMVPNQLGIRMKWELKTVEGGVV